MTVNTCRKVAIISIFCLVSFSLIPSSANSRNSYREQTTHSPQEIDAILEESMSNLKIPKTIINGLKYSECNPDRYIHLDDTYNQSKLYIALKVMRNLSQTLQDYEKREYINKRYSKWKIFLRGSIAHPKGEGVDREVYLPLLSSRKKYIKNINTESYKIIKKIKSH